MTIHNRSAVTQTDAMTHSQIGLLFESLLSGKPGLNLLQIVTRFDGENVDGPRLHASWQDLAAAHEVLRLRLEPLAPEGPQQTALASVAVDFVEQDWQDRPAGIQDAALDLWLDQDRRQGVQVDAAPCWRVRLIRLAPARSVMVWTIHHAMIDGHGLRLLLRELFAFYGARMAGRVVQPDRRQRQDFLDHCRAVAGLNHGPAREFFRQYLRGFDQPNMLDPVFSPSRQQALAADPQLRHHITLRLDETLCEAIRARAARAGVTTANMVAAAWGLVLARCSGRDEALFGLTRTGRHLLADSEPVAGCQINTLPCRVTLRDQTVDGILRDLRNFTLAIHPFEHVPLTELARLTDLPGGVGLFDSIVMFDRGSLPEQMRGLGPEWAHRHIDEISHMATGLTLSVYDDPQMLMRLEYDPAKISPGGGARLADYVQGALAALAAADDLPLSHIDMLPRTESRRLLQRALPERPILEDGESVMARFEATARQRPDQPAIKQIGKRAVLTYGKLDARANLLAHRLRDIGVGPGDIVGLALPRSADFVVAMLAVLKAQAAFLPLDPSYPTAALQDMITRSGSVALFSCHDAMAQLGPQTIPVLLMDDPGLGGESASPPNRSRHDPERLAYVIFTSGSTGTPKGVAVPHRALSQHAQAITRLFDLTDQDRVLQFASLNFDVSIEEILPTLLAGARLVLRNDAVAQSMPQFLAALAAHRITVSNLPTAFWHVLVAHLEDADAVMPDDLRLVIVGGERVSGDLLLRWRARCPQIRWLNCYGPTEATITSTWYDAGDPVFDGGEIPIGRPTDHARTYVMTPDGSLAPDGVAGELWLGGPAVALGYLNRPDLTAEVFLPDRLAGGAPGRLYRSGDRVAWRDDGVLAFHGRMDRQIKLRGFRIELSAIEAVLEADASTGRSMPPWPEDPGA